MSRKIDVERLVHNEFRNGLRNSEMQLRDAESCHQLLPPNEQNDLVELILFHDFENES